MNECAVRCGAVARLEEGSEEHCEELKWSTGYPMQTLYKVLWVGSGLFIGYIKSFQGISMVF